MTELPGWLRVEGGDPCSQPRHTQARVTSNFVQFFKYNFEDCFVLLKHSYKVCVLNCICENRTSSSSLIFL